MVVNQATCYSTAFPFVDRRSIEAIPHLLSDEVAKGMRSDGFPEDAIQLFIAPLASIGFARTESRVALGHLNQATIHAGFGFDWFYERNSLPSGPELASYLNEVIYGGKFSIEELARQLGCKAPARVGRIVYVSYLTERNEFP